MDTVEPAAPAAERPRTTGWWTGRSELAVAALLLVMAAFLAWQTAVMSVPPDTDFPGPQFFPVLVTVLMAVAGLALAVTVVRTPARTAEPGAPAEDEASEPETRIGHSVQEDATGAHPHTAESIDWRTVAIVVGTLVVFIAALETVGWLLCGALLFFGVAYALGARRLAFDIGVALVFSSVVQLLFVGALGLNLPAGVLGGIL